MRLFLFQSPLVEFKAGSQAAPPRGESHEFIFYFFVRQQLKPCCFPSFLLSRSHVHSLFPFPSLQQDGQAEEMLGGPFPISDASPSLPHSKSPLLFSEEEQIEEERRRSSGTRGTPPGAGGSGEGKAEGN